jgi:hypothetical protein
MHAIRGTVGYDPTPTNPDAKRASRRRFFEGLSQEAQDTAGAIERNAERIAEQRRLEAIVASGKRPSVERPTLASYEAAKAHLDQAIADLDRSPQSTADLAAYGISD